MWKTCIFPLLNNGHCKICCLIVYTSKINVKMAFISVILLSNVIWLVTISSVRSIRLDTSLKLPASEAQILDLAQHVCADLYKDVGGQTKVNKCIEDFNDADKTMQVSRAGFRVRCHADTTVDFHIQPSKYTRLVVVVPDPLDFNQRLRYRIMKPGTKLSELETTPDELTIFTSTFDDGRHSLWLKESKIKKWEAPTHKEYDIQVQFPNITDNDTVEGVFTWNQTGEADSCFNFLSWCDNSGLIMDTTIKPDTRPLVVVPLPKGDSCKARVAGAFGTTTLSFETPASDQRNDEEDVKKTSPLEVSVHAAEISGAWRVAVNWSRPELAPDYYNVTLFAEDTVSLLVPGNALEVTFNNVSLSEFYHVAISSVLGQYAAHTSRRAMLYGDSGKLSERDRDEWVWAGAAGGAWGAVGAAGAVLLVFKRYTKRKPVPIKRILPVAEVKPLEESLPESVSEGPSSDEWEIRSERLLLHEVIGEGAFGVVRRGTLAPNGTNVAVKMLKEFSSLEEQRAFLLEMELMKSVGCHGHVVSLVGCCSGRAPLIVAEYCSRGDLLSVLRRAWDALVFKKYYNNNVENGCYRNDLFLKCKKREPSTFFVNKLYETQHSEAEDLTPLDLLSFCRQIAMGMEFLAANKLVHRDLAARNILVTADKTLKIADFGLSRDIYEENHYKQKSNGKMPVKWMALESLTRRVFTTQSDVWSFGVVVWEIVTLGASPYPEVQAARLPRLLRAGYRMSRPPNCSKPLYEVMQSCWHACPQSRPTFTQIHATLDELLQGASADSYLSLELDEPPPAAPRYFTIITKAKRYWSRAESYERPLLAPCSNIYTSPPESNKTTLATIKNLPT